MVRHLISSLESPRIVQSEHRTVHLELLDEIQRMLVQDIHDSLRVHRGRAVIPARLLPTILVVAIGCAFSQCRYLVLSFWKRNNVRASLFWRDIVSPNGTSDRCGAVASEGRNEHGHHDTNVDGGKAGNPEPCEAEMLVYGSVDQTGVSGIVSRCIWCNKFKRVVLDESIGLQAARRASADVSVGQKTVRVEFRGRQLCWYGNGAGGNEGCCEQGFEIHFSSVKMRGYQISIWSALLVEGNSLIVDGSIGVRNS